MIHPAVARLSREEKASLVSGASFYETESIDHAGIEGAYLTDGPHGIRMVKSADEADDSGVLTAEPATAFPTAAALGSSWDTALLHDVGVALGVECRTLGVDVLLGPGINMKRSPLCGRNFEYFAEDPYLAGHLGAGWVKGIQSQGVGASVKHFAANNQETNRLKVDVDVDERTLREIYLAAFEHVVADARPATIMSSYNRINGVTASQNPWLLTKVLRDDWNFDGYVVSDWGAISDPVAAVAAGNDLEMPSMGAGSPRAIVAAIEEGRLDEAVLDAAVSRILSVHDRLRATRREPISPDFDAHHALARRAASAGTVLLTNENDLLPLDPRGEGRIAVIGEFARTPRYQGAGSSFVNSTRLDAALPAIETATDREIVFSPGYRLDGEDDERLIAEAVEIARQAASVVVFLGLPDGVESEGFDREHIDMPAVQLALLDALFELDVPIVAVLSNGGIVDLGPLVGKASAILEMWLGGQASGAAAADILFGISEPEGRLAETIPIRLADTPAYLNWPGKETVTYGERIYIGYRWYDARDLPVRFPFGHGLGYTSFEYSKLEIVVPDPRAARATVRATITNTGSREGAEVAQLYVSSPTTTVDRPVRELRGFSKVRIPAGGNVEVEFELGERDFAFWGEDGWTVDPGDYTISVGRSSRSLPLVQTIALDVPQVLRPLTGASTIEEWLAHPVGAGLMREMFAAMPADSPVPATEEVFKLASSVSLHKFLAFGGGDPNDAIGPLVRAVEAATVDALN